MKRLILPVLAALSLAACATAPTLYQPAASARAVGFSEYRIEQGRYRITFQGGPGAPAAQVTDYALLRAADLALADGYDWFRVADRFAQGQADRGPQMSVGVGSGGGGYGYGGSYGYGRRSGVSVGLSTSFALGGGPSMTTTLEVIMGKGPRPADSDVYDARDVRQSIGARV
ncbi:CC0125/CC1285 family lipoprotein [Phenylobacterium sp.]|uniref:CC0125/CC1285 family lipoprotein n=1 Tax=Phenylobacterium sp. TaxID=1871053 RepID=UPI0039832D8F